MRRILEFTLRLFPASFRERYGEELIETLVSKTSDARRRRGLVGVLALWAFQGPDLVRAAWSERRWGRDFRYAWRTLGHAPGFTAIAIVTLALGIGATTAVFSVVNGVLLEPLPYDDPDRLVGIYHSTTALGSTQHTPATWFTYRDEAEVFESIAAWRDAQATLTGGGAPENAQAILVSEGFFRTLGIQPSLGRAFTAEDASPGDPPTIIASHGLWQQRFGGDPSVIGQTLTVQGVTLEIVGVMPQGFRFLDFEADLYLPLRLDESDASGVLSFDYNVFARLRDGATIEEADRELTRLLPTSVARYGWITEEKLAEFRLTPNARPLKDAVVGDIGRVLWVLLGTVSLVLLIACANVANLFLVRAESRRHEVALRTALGASRGRLVRQFLSESLMLTFGGGLVGLALAVAGLRLLVRVVPGDLPRVSEIGVDPETLIFAIAVSVLTGLLFGILPAFASDFASLAGALAEGARSAGQSRHRHRVRNLFATAQVAVALVLLIGSGLMIRSFRALRSVEPGFVRPEQVLTFRLSLPVAPYPDDDDKVEAYRRILERLDAIPGVTSVAAISGITMEGRTNANQIYIEEAPTPEGERPRSVGYKAVAGDYFATMGIPLLAGRAIDWDDIENRRPVGLITGNLAREVWGNPGNAVGKRIRHRPEDPWREIVGVVGDVRDGGLRRDPFPVIFWPLAVEDFVGFEVWVRRDMAIVVRSPGQAPATIVPAAQQAVWSVDPDLPLASIQTLDRIVARDMALTSFVAIMLVIAAGVAVILGTVGVYGVLSYMFSRRTREIGVRLAIGATGRDLAGLVLRQGGVVAAVGVLVGGGAAAALTRFLTTLLYEVTPADPLTYASALMIILVAALLACFLPARRAAHIDPVESLRRE